jgi:hypothetical protein
MTWINVSMSHVKTEQEVKRMKTISVSHRRNADSREEDGG